MDKNLTSNLFKTLLFGIAWAVIAFIIAIILVKSKQYNLKDVLFIEGIILIAISILSAIGGNSTGLSLKGFGTNNASLTSYANLEITKREREKNPMKQTLSFGLSSFSLICGGILLIILNYII